MLSMLKKSYKKHAYLKIGLTLLGRPGFNAWDRTFSKIFAAKKIHLNTLTIHIIIIASTGVRERLCCDNYIDEKEKKACPELKLPVTLPVT